MKTKYLLIAVLLTVLITGCKINDPYHYHDYDTTPPEPPNGITVLNGDNVVDLYWAYNREDDVAGYTVYYSYTYNGKYTEIGSTSYNSFTDYDAQNGNTYYYAVTAYDYDGNESELSYDVIYSTPRPEGFNQSIFDYRRFPSTAGYSFSTYSVVAYDNDNSDFFFENFNDDFYLDVWDDSDIQDMGPTTDIYDIPYAPLNGWSPTKDARVYPGHTYIIWTWDNHFAKIRISTITRDRIVFDWAYQLVEGESQLKQSVIKTKRDTLNRTFIDRGISQ